MESSSPPSDVNTPSSSNAAQVFFARNNGLSSPALNQSIYNLGQVQSERQIPIRSKSQSQSESQGQNQSQNQSQKPQFRRIRWKSGKRLAPSPLSGSPIFSDQGPLSPPLSPCQVLPSSSSSLSPYSPYYADNLALIRSGYTPSFNLERAEKERAEREEAEKVTKSKGGRKKKLTTPITTMTEPRARAARHKGHMNFPSECMNPFHFV